MRIDARHVLVGAVGVALVAFGAVVFWLNSYGVGSVGEPFVRW